MSSPRRVSPLFLAGLPWFGRQAPRSRHSDLEKEEERLKVEAKEVPTEADSQQRQLERTEDSLKNDERHDLSSDELKFKKLAELDGLKRKHRQMDADMDALRKRQRKDAESLKKEATKSRELKRLHEKKTAECDVLKAKNQRMEEDMAALRVDLSESEQGKMIAELKIQKLGLSSQIETLEAKVKIAENESHLARSAQESMAAEMKQTKQELTSIMSSYKDIAYDHRDLQDKVKEAESLAQQIESDKKKMAEELKEKEEHFKRESQQLEKENNDFELHNSELQSTVKAADHDRLVCAGRHEQEIKELTKAQQTVHEILQADMKQLEKEKGSLETVHEILQADMKQLEKEKGSLKKQMCQSDHDTAMMKKLVEQYTGENQQLKKEKSDLQGEMKKAESVAQQVRSDKERMVEQLMYLERADGKMKMKTEHLERELKEQISEARYSAEKDAAAMKKQFTIECQQLKKEKSDLQGEMKKAESVAQQVISDKERIVEQLQMYLEEAMEKAEHLAQQVTSENEMIAEKQKQQLICLKSKLEAAENLAQQTKSDKERMVEELKEKEEQYKRKCQQLEENYSDLKASCSTVLQQNGEMFLRMESDIGNAKQRAEQSYLQMNPGASDMSSMRAHRSRSEPPRFHDQQGGDFRTSEQGGGVSRSPILSGSPRSLHRTSLNRSQKASSLSLPGMSSMAISEQQEWNGQSTWDHHSGTDTWPRRHAAGIAPQSMPHPMEAFEQQGMPRTRSLSSLPVQGPNRALRLSNLMPYVPELAPVRSAIAGYLDMHTQWLTLEQSNAGRPGECLQKLLAQWLDGEEEDERPHTWGYFIKLVKFKGIEKHQLANKVRRDQFQFIPPSDL